MIISNDNSWKKFCITVLKWRIQVWNVITSEICWRRTINIWNLKVLSKKLRQFPQFKFTIVRTWLFHLQKDLKIKRRKNRVNERKTWTRHHTASSLSSLSFQLTSNTQLCVTICEKWILKNFNGFYFVNWMQ